MYKTIINVSLKLDLFLEGLWVGRLRGDMNGENVFVGFLVGTVVAAGIVLGLFDGFAAVGRLEVDETAADGLTVR